MFEEGLAAAAPLEGVTAIAVEVGVVDAMLLQEVLLQNDEIRHFVLASRTHISLLTLRWRRGHYNPRPQCFLECLLLHHWDKNQSISI